MIPNIKDHSSVIRAKIHALDALKNNCPEMFASHPEPEPYEAPHESQGCTGWAFVALIMGSALVGLFLAWVCQ